MSSTVRSVILAAALVVIGWPQQAAATTYYTLTDLGALSGGSSRALGINDLGQVVGEASIAPGPDGVGYTHAFLWSGGSMTDIGGLGGFTSAANDINNLGQVVGSAHVLDYDGHAFLYQSGVMTDLGPKLGTTGNSTARAINDSGQIVGDVDLGGSRPFLLSANTVTFIDALGGPGADMGRAADINNRGQVVGEIAYSFTVGTETTGSTRAFLYDGQQVTTFGYVEPGWNSRAVAMNDDGVVLAAGSGLGIFLYDAGALTPINAGSVEVVPNDINGQGVAVGARAPQNPRRAHAYVFAEGRWTRLDSLVGPADAGWQLREATAINELGQIVGRGSYLGGPEHAILLNPTTTPPVPEPATLVLLVGGGLLMLIACRRAPTC